MLESGQRGKDRSSNPHRVLALRRSNDLDLHCGRSKGGDFLGHALSDAWEHSGTSGHDNVGVQVFTDVNIALHDGLESAVVDSERFLSDKRRLEKYFWATEALVSNGEHTATWKFVSFF
jgi:hypothetical protein